MKTTETYLPVFSGFYNTIWDMLSDHLAEYEAQHFDCEYDDLDIDWNEFHQDLSKMIVHKVCGELQTLGYIWECKFQELKSPRQYNFTNDSINVQIDLSEANIYKIRDTVQEYFDEYESYVQEATTSAPGFIPYYSYQDFIQDESEVNDGVFDHKHHLGFILGFVCDIEGITEDDIHDQVTGNIALPLNNHDELSKNQ